MTAAVDDLWDQTLAPPAGPWTTIDLAARSDDATRIDATLAWVLPGLLERGSRLLFAGDEGVGKSLFIGQLAVRLASGLPCFPGDPVGPMRVLVVDTELNERTIRRRLTPMADHANLTPGQLLYALAPAGINLLDSDERSAFAGLCRGFKPHLVVIDSLYRAFIGDPDDPRVGGEVQRVLDETRASTGAALLLACHYRKRSNEGRVKRTLDDIAGSRVWKAWPETVTDLTAKSLRILKDREGLATELTVTRTAAGEWENDPDGWPFTSIAVDTDAASTWQGHTLIQSYALQVLARGDGNDDGISTNRVTALITEQRHIEGHKSGFNRDNVTAALGELREAGRARTSIGPRNANHWHITPAGLDHISTDNPDQEPGW